MRLKIRKTATSKRGTYQYRDDNGAVIADIRPDKNSHVNEEHIKLLHLLDDAEVRNNLKHIRTAPPTPEETELEIHLNFSQSSRWVLSLDQMVDEDGESFKENRAVLEEAYRNEEARRHDVGRELLYEAVALLSAKEQELFRRRYTEDMTETAIAKEKGVSVAAIHKQLKRMEGKLKEIIFKKILGQG